ncbi:MAG: glycosyltransferase [Erysipelotrichaceae bacterium]
MSTYKESEGFLCKAIESILNQSYQDFEFIIILDNPDNQLHIKIIQAYLKQDKRIRFFINEKNMGLSKSLNKALSYAEGKYIARMDADDIALSQRLEKQLAYLVEHNYDLIGGAVEVIDEDEKILYNIKHVPTKVENIKKIVKYNQCIAHPTWFAKKTVFDKLNGYREIPFCEDYDFTLRALMRGFKISNLDEIVLKYRMSKQSISRNNLLRQFLFMKYITCEYQKGQIANIEQANTYVEQHYSANKEERYKKANVYFNQMLKNLQSKQCIKFISNGIKIVFTSFTFLQKIFRFFMVSIYK